MRIEQELKDLITLQGVGLIRKQCIIEHEKLQTLLFTNLTAKFTKKLMNILKCQ
jgi:hypothetical protein